MCRTFSFAVIFFCFFVGLYAQDKANKPTEDTAIFSGVVLGFNQVLNLSNLTCTPNVQEIIFRKDKAVSGKEKSKYIIIQFRSVQGAVDIPRECMQGKKPILIKLKRNPQYDHPIEFPHSKSVSSSSGLRELSLPSIKWFNEVEGKKVPLSKPIPCYAYIEICARETDNSTIPAP